MKSERNDVLEKIGATEGVVVGFGMICGIVFSVVLGVGTVVVASGQLSGDRAGVYLVGFLMTAVVAGATIAFSIKKRDDK